jgi:predicted DNA-binding transcriptional regulator YafY
MLRDLQRYLAIGNPIQIIYQDDKARITKRTIRILAIDDSVVKAYCYSRKGPRIFKITNILALAPSKNSRAG